MRPIKFRLWNGIEMVKIESLEFFEDGGIRVNGSDAIPQIMQFTGLLDRNGVEAYEGDIIVPWRPNSRKVKYPAYIRARVLEWKTTDSNRGLTRTGFNIAGGDFEIIGNIYQPTSL